MGAQPLVSFVVSVYNLEDYIGQCLDSILEQPFENFEIVLVDNNSTDKSKEICQMYAARYKQIRYFELEGEPLMGRAGLYGLKAACGKYIQVVDGDDRLASGIYQEIANILRKKQPDLFFGQFETFADGSKLNFIDVRYSSKAINDSDIDSAIAYLTGQLPFHLPTWRFIFRQDFLIARKELHYREGWDSIATKAAPINYDIYSNNIRLIMSKTLYYIDKPIYQYRLRSSSISRISAAEQASEGYLTYILHKRLLELEGISLQKKSYLLKIMDAWYYSLSLALSILDKKELLWCAEKINKYKKEICDQESNGETENSLEVIQRVAWEKVRQLSEKLSSKKVYLAPTGNVGSNMKDALEACNIHINGFFDNDTEKQGVILKGASIQLPQAAIKMQAPIMIVIASMYENVRQDLKKQFLSLGISEDNIIVVTF